jgi:hypothetical protein
VNVLASLWVFCAFLMCLWEETGQNPFIFCYRIAWGAFWTVRAHALAPIAAPTRNNAECWMSFSTSSTRCLTPTD